MEDNANDWSANAPVSLEVVALRFSRDARFQLQNLSFSIRPGAFVGIVGPNGAGKTTLLRIIAGLESGAEGAVMLDGKLQAAYTQRAYAQRVAMLHQHIPQNVALSVRELIALGNLPRQPLRGLVFSSWTGRLMDKQTTQRVTGIAAQFDLLDYLDHPFAQLSGGQQQRAMLAKAFMQQPGLLLLDEPTNSLDLKHQIRLTRLLKHSGISVLAAVHDVNFALANCDDLLLLDHGELIAKGSAEAVFSNETIRQIYGIDGKLLAAGSCLEKPMFVPGR